MLGRRARLAVLDVKNEFLGLDWWNARIAADGVDVDLTNWGARDTSRAGPARIVSVKDMANLSGVVLMVERKKNW